ncbi:MAG: ABC transporter substrate-binding protein [Aliidongia sp.]
MVSNGAFTLNKWVPLGEIALVRNPQFHDAGAVALGEVDYVMGDDHSAALKRYEADELDVVSLLGADLQRIQHERPDELHSNPQLTTYYFLFNMSAGIDPHVRRALSMVIDRDVLESKIVRGDQRPAYGLVPPGLPGYVVQRPEWADLPMAERIAAAKALLAEADIGKPLKIHILAPKLDSLQLDINAILAMWHSALGIDAEVEIVEPRIFLNRYDQNDFEVVYLPVTGDYLDPWDLLSGFLSDKKFDNYGNSKYDALLDESRRAASSADRMALLRSAEALLLADQPLIPVSYGTVQLLVKPRLHGYESAPLGIHPSRFLRVTDMP